MSAIASFMTADLSSLRLVGGGAPARASWTPGADTPGESVEGLRARATLAAQWAAAQIGGKARLGLACLDIDGSTCAWIRSPAAEGPVLAATLRTASQDWGEHFVPGSVEQLRDADASAQPAPFAGLRGGQKKTGAIAAVNRAETVVNCPTALARIWLDELDARGVRADRAMTLWHALAVAFGSGDAASAAPVTGVVLVEPGVRAVWAWSRGGGLLAGGVVRFDPPADPSEERPDDDAESSANRAAGRLALDWLSWATQLGVTPASLVIVGESGAGGSGGSGGVFTAAVARRWPALPLKQEATDDPIGRTLALALERPASVLSARRALVGLSTRPTRALRTTYRWAAAALVALAAGVVGLGYRMGQARGTLATMESGIRAEQVKLVKELNDPTLEQARNLSMMLGSKLAELRKREPPKLPPAPRPMHEEMRRIAGVLEKFEGVKLIQLSIDAKQNSTLQLTIPNRRVGEEIRLALQEQTSTLLWSPAAGAVSDQQLRLNGNWTN